jgi:hypothetical protein
VHVESGCTLDWAAGNIDADPCFLDLAVGDYHLLLGSPCINTGDPAYAGDPCKTDLDGEPRVMDGRVDMGIDEFNPDVPRFEISPRQLHFGARLNGPDPNGQILTVRNNGGGTLNWVITCDCNWMHIDPNTGSSAGQPNDVILSPDISGLLRGSYDCQLTVSDQNTVNNPQLIQVRLRVFVSDFDLDGDVDGRDFAILGSAWKSKVSDENWNLLCDVSEPPDGIIDYRDLAVVGEDWLAQM